MFPLFHASDFIDWGTRVTVKRVTPTIVDGETVESSSKSTLVSGVLVPMSADQLKMKPEGQRDWHWWYFISFDVNSMLDHNDIIMPPDQKPYRVMNRLLMMAQGFVQYEIVEDFQ